MPTRSLAPSSLAKVKRNSGAQQPRAKRPVSAAGTVGRGTTASPRPNAKAKTVKDWRTVIIVWDDAWDSPADYSSENLATECKPCVRWTVGFVTLEDQNQIVVCQVDDRRSETPGHGDCANIFRIPRGMIREIIELIPKG